MNTVLNNGLRLALGVLAFVLLCAPASSQMNFLGLQAVPLGFCQLTPTSAALLSTCPNFPTNARYAYIEAVTTIAYYRDDGTAPTVAVGMALQPNTGIWYAGFPGNVNIIQASGAIDVLFYR